ncbi:MAG: hypothetical protein PHI98_00035 [Eubacteriales bacterium]|nr:hypothetical protein [Eubacteriales bacterium]
MAEYDRVLCLFCKVGKEQSIVKYIHENGYGRALFPQKTRKTRDKSTRAWKEELVPMLPGYVFVYETDEAMPRDKLLSLTEVIRILGYEAGESDYLKGHDLEFAKWLWQIDGKLEKLKIVQVGERIQIADDVFRSLLGNIRKVDKRRQTCEVELDSRSILQHIWLPYEMIDPSKQKTTDVPKGATT